METNKIKKPFYKKWWFWVIVAIVLCAIISGTQKKEAPENSNDVLTTNNPATTESPDTTAVVETTTIPDTEETSEPDDKKDELKEKYGLVFFGNVRNDTTGRWRYAEYASTTEPQEIAAEYYKAYFSSDDEIHALINMTLKTTSCVSVLSPGILDVTVHEYVKDEEHDAKELYGGVVLGEYYINIETGVVSENLNDVM